LRERVFGGIRAEYGRTLAAVHALGGKTLADNPRSRAASGTGCPTSTRSTTCRSS
jgi:hypothetical protein